MTKSILKLLILQTHPIQYYAPLYRVLSERNRLEVVVVYLTDGGAKPQFDPGFGREVQWDIDLLSGYRHYILKPGSDLSKMGFWNRTASNLSDVIQKEQADWVLLYGYASWMNWKALRLAQSNRMRTLYHSDSNARVLGSLGIAASLAKKTLLAYFFNRIDCFLSPSEANREYLVKFGASADRIHRLPFAIDINRFCAGTVDNSRKYSFVWAGKFVAHKALTDYLFALKTLDTKGIPFKAMVIGDGPDKESCAEQLGSLVDKGLLVHKGFVNQKEMPSLLAAADAFVFTSIREPYGLIATEAAAAGCALICADTIGCVGQDGAAQPNRNALIYRCGDVSELTECMLETINNRSRLIALKAASVEIAKEHDLKVAAEIIEGLLYKQSSV